MIGVFVPVREDKTYTGYIITERGCWEWVGGYRNNGYGCIHSTAAGRRVQAHRWMYERIRGPIPEGLQIDHLCRNKACVNPDHLEPVTQRENILRSDSIAAVHARKTHCPNGHPLSGLNVAYWEGGHKRRCRRCNSIRCAEKYQRRRAKRLAGKAA